MNLPIFNLSISFNFLISNMLQGITAEHIHDVAMKYIYDQDPVLACIGPCEALPDYVEMRTRMSWLFY